MLPRRLKACNIGPYKDVEIDFSAIPGELIAVAGRNGEGKTMLLETLYAGMYRTFPSRPAGIYKYCTARDARIEYDFALNGTSYQSTIVIDSKARKMEPVLAIAGRPITDGKTGTFDKEIEKLLGPATQVLASSYGAQTKKGNFIELDKVDRKDLFIRMIGLTLLQNISDLAKSSGAKLELQKENYTGRIITLRSIADQTTPDVTVLIETLATDKARLQTAEQTRLEYQTKISQFQADAGRLSKLAIEANDLQSSINQKNDEIHSATIAIAAQLLWRNALEDSQKQYDSIRQLIEITTERMTTLQAKCSRGAQVKSQVDQLTTRIAKSTAEISAMNLDIAEQKRLAENVESLRAKSDVLIELRANRESSQQQINRLQGELSIIQQTEQEYSAATLENVKATNKILAELTAAQTLLDQARRDEVFIKGVPCQGEGIYADCQFLTNAVKSSAQIDEYAAAVDNSRVAILALNQELSNTQRPDLVAKKALQERVAELNKELAQYSSSISQNEVAVRLLPADEAAHSKLKMLAEQLTTAQQAYDLLLVDYNQVKDELKEIEGFQREVTEIATELEINKKQLSDLESVIQRGQSAASEIAVLDSKKQYAKEAIGTLQSRLLEIESEMAGIVASRKEQTAVEQQLREVTATILKLKTNIETCQNDLAKAQALAATIEKAKTELTVAEAELAPLLQRISRFNRIAKWFGPMEIQSFEIDCAGPEVSRIANDLLFSCFGPRYSIKLITQEQKADGSGYKDEFDVSVYDQKYEHWVSIDDLSGGQKVIVSEALALAIALFNKEKNGIAWDTLFRDEVAAALDDTYAPQYVQMLRAARAKGHFSKVVFISHQGKMKELADAKIVVADGQITVEA